MSLSAVVARALDLPPAYRAMPIARRDDVFFRACALAREGEAGALVYCDQGRTVAWSVVLAPEEPLRRARRVFLAGMNALAEAIGSEAPPGKPVGFAWPDVVRFAGAPLAAGGLGWAERCGEDDVPAWLVFSAAVIASKSLAEEPDAMPDSTSLEEEGFPSDCGRVLVEGFARYFLRQIDLWSERGFEPIAQRYLELLAEPPGRNCGIDHDGSCIMRGREPSARLGLVAALRAAGWRDPETGGPRL